MTDMTSRMMEMTMNWIGAVHVMWKKPAAKSILDVSVEMWLTSLPLGNSPRDFWVRRRARLKMDEMMAERNMTPTPRLPTRTSATEYHMMTMRLTKEEVMLQ